MTVPSGTFAPGGRTGLARQNVRPMVPLDWLRAHSGTRRWHTRIVRDTISGLGEVTDLALQLRAGFEAVIESLAILFKANISGRSTNTFWRILFDGVPYYQSVHGGGAGAGAATVGTDGRFDYLHAGDGFGNSWGQLDLWVPELTRIEVGMTDGTGVQTEMGWVMYGFYFPTIVREEWAVHGWRRR